MKKYFILSCLESRNFIHEGQLPDMPDGLHWSFQAFHFIQRISARVMLCCCGLFFFTMTRVYHNTLCEITPFQYLDMTNYNRATFLAHKHVGLYIVIFTIFVHVLGGFVRNSHLYFKNLRPPLA